MNHVVESQCYADISNYYVFQQSWEKTVDTLLTQIMALLHTAYFYDTQIYEWYRIWLATDWADHGILDITS